MTVDPPRVRVFAGPNGSGKSTLKRSFGRPAEWFGCYVNPDDLEATVRATGTLSLTSFGLAATTDEVRGFLKASALLRKSEFASIADSVDCRDGSLEIDASRVDSYVAAVLADFVRGKLLAARRTFTFETVMSFPDKVELLREAQRVGFRTYLYFVATDDPDINVRRVRNRVADGGHDVPREKIVERYHRSISLLFDAIRCSHRAFLFDTSDDLAPWYFAEITDGARIDLKSGQMPTWFEPIWNRFDAGPPAS